jgi:hypothetical protein
MTNERPFHYPASEDHAIERLFIQVIDDLGAIHFSAEIT